MAQTTLDTLTAEEWNKILDTAMNRCITKQVNPAFIAQPHDSHTSTAAQNIQAPWGEQHLQSMLASRMNWGYGTKCPFQRVLPWKVTPETVVVFVVLADSALLIEDDAHLYPSDALVTQLRILAEAT